MKLNCIMFRELREKSDDVKVIVSIRFLNQRIGLVFSPPLDEPESQM